MLGLESGGRTNRAELGVAADARAVNVAAGSRISPAILRGSVRLVEALIVAAVGATISAIYVGPAEVEARWLYMLATFGTAATVVAVLEALGLYRSSMSSFVPQLSRLVAGWTIAFAILIAVLFFVKAGSMYSRVWLASWYSSGLVGLSIWRGVVASVVRRWERQGRLQRRAAIVGGADHVDRLTQAFQRSGSNEVRITAVADDTTDGDFDRVEEAMRRQDVDLVILAVPLAEEERIMRLFKRIWVFPIDVRIAADATRLRLRPRAYSYIGGVPMLDVLDRPISDWDAVKKRLFDRIVGAFALLFALPIMVLVAIAIKLDSRGPVLFKQPRYGFNNELIDVYKFRSMYTDRSDIDASKLVTRGDARVTRIGRFIRRTSIDELPQLFNVVFFGNLSLVGPRPHAVKAKAADDLYHDVVDGYFARHRVKPGMTGWAQINGWRGETDTHEKIQQRVSHDLYYIEHWSVLFDLYILIKTPWVLLVGTDAY
jgi:Undecaprenyl-phosphate glucose phosphotransferase